MKNIIRKFHYILLLSLLFTSGLAAQKAVKKQADQYFKAGNYREALELYKSLGTYIVDDGKTLINKGISAYNCNEPDVCIQSLELAYKLKTISPDIYYYTAKAYQATGDYTNAVIFYKNCLKDELVKNKAEVINEIARCEHSKRMSYLEQLAYVENFGEIVNSKYDEINPVQSPNYQNRYYFSSNRDVSVGGPRNAQGVQDEIAGKYCYDMYGIELQKGNWTAIFPFTSLQNTAKNEIIQDFSRDGQVMFYTIATNNGSPIICADTFYLSTEERAFPKGIQSDFHPEKGDKDFTIFSDSMVLFSSNRDGGYGGYDLYIMSKIDGKWAPSINLGPWINSAANEINPFLCFGANELFFSSDRIEGMGGYDIFHTVFNDQKSMWEKPKNMALPINSPKDDLYPLISGDGNQLIFSSNRINGYGGFDLYTAYLKNQVLDQISFSEKPAFFESLIHPMKESNTATIDSVNTSTPTFLKRTFLENNMYYSSDANLLAPQNMTLINSLADIMTLLPNLKVTLSGHSTMDNQPMFALFFSMKRAEKVMEALIKKGISPDRIQVLSFGASYPMIKGGSSERLNNRIEIHVTNYDSDQLTIVKENQNINEALRSEAIDRYSEANQGTNFRVIIGTTSQMLKYDFLNTYNDVSLRKNTDGTYSYYVGALKNYGEARSLKNEFLAQGIIEAKIEVFHNGEKADRNTIDELSASNPELVEYKKFQGN